jgi:NitT/TauT family transport system substrate-binding protein
MGHGKGGDSLAMKRLLAGACVLVFGLGSAVARADDLAPVRLGVNKLGATTSIAVAQQQGFFKQHGLDLQVTEIPLTDQSILLLQSKRVDIVLQIPGTAMQAKERGFDMVLVGQNETAGTTPPVSNAIVVPAKSPIQDVKDLKGKRLATSSTHNQGFVAVKARLQQAGVAIDDVKTTPAPFSAAGDLLRTGQVDAAVTLDPYTSQILKSGNARPISWYMIETIPDQPVGSWWALRSWAEQHKKEVAAFNDAVAAAHAWLNADPDRARKAIADYSGLDLALVKDMPLISWKSKVDPKAWQAVSDMMHAQGELAQQHDVSEYLLK